jgi:hypothetical protein
MGQTIHPSINQSTLTPIPSAKKSKASCQIIATDYKITCVLMTMMVMVIIRN